MEINSFNMRGVNMNKIMKIALFIIIMFNFGNLAYAGDNQGAVKVGDLEIDLWVNKSEGSTYYYGEDLAIYFRTTDDCYVVVYDIDPEGNVSLLYPDDYESSCFVNGGEVVRIPDTSDDYHLEISGPSGQEHIYAVATYNQIEPPDFISYEYFEYGNWDSYYDDFIHTANGEREEFVSDLNRRIAQAEHVTAHTMFFIDENYRHHSWYRHWTYDPYYVGSVWIGTGYSGCEVWIDGIFWGIAPVLVPEIYIGRHWVWIYYNGYPCWQDYFHVKRGQRCYVDAKIGRRYLDYEYGRAAMRDWKFKYEVEENGSDFMEKAQKARQKHVSSKPSAPSKVVQKYSRIEASGSAVTKQQTIKQQTSEKVTRSITKKQQTNEKTTRSVSKQETIEKKPTNRFKTYKTDSKTDKSNESTKSSGKTNSSSIEKKSSKTQSGSTAIKKQKTSQSSSDNTNKTKSSTVKTKSSTSNNGSSNIKKTKSSSSSSSSSGASKSKSRSTSSSSKSGKQSKSSGSDKEKSSGKRGKR